MLKLISDKCVQTRPTIRCFRRQLAVKLGSHTKDKLTAVGFIRRFATLCTEIQIVIDRIAERTGDFVYSFPLKGHNIAKVQYLPMKDSHPHQNGLFLDSLYIQAIRSLFDPCCG